MSEPQFKVGDRVHGGNYVRDWGTVTEVCHTVRGATHGVTGSPLPDTTWYQVKFDCYNGTMLMDDAHGVWDMARIIPPAVARRYGFGTDPHKEEVA